MFLIILLATVYLWVVVQHYRRVSRLPPGPFSLPIIGNIPQILLYAWKTGGVVSTLDLFRKKYGSVFTLWLGPIPHVSITDFQTAHEVFVKNGSKYADKPVSPVFHETRNGYGIVAINGTLWQEIRRFSLQTFRNMGVGKDIMETKIMEELDHRCAFLNKSAVNGVSEVQVQEFFDLTVGSIINSIMLGKRFDETTQADFFHLKKLVDESSKLVTPLDLVLPVWLLRMFSNKRVNLMMDAQTETMDYLARDAVKRYEDVKDGKITIDPENPKDYVDSFILKMMQDDSDKKAFSIPSLKAVLLDLWLTGQETTTTTLVSGFANLLNSPHVIKKAREELMRVTDNGSRLLSWTDKNDTVYLNAVIAEIQRHASILNINFWKINHEFTHIGGHPVDAGALIAAQLSTLHVDEKNYSNPKHFDPERFMKNKDLIQQLIPFGIGKRACTGEALARAELYLILGNLLLRYDFEPCDDFEYNIDVAPFSFGKKSAQYKMKFIKI